MITKKQIARILFEIAVVAAVVGAFYRAIKFNDEILKTLNFILVFLIIIYRNTQPKD